MRILLIFFIVLPIAEIFLLIKVGSIIGPIYTIGLVLLTAFIGLGLLKQQGYSALERARGKMNHGTLPAQEMVEGIFLAVGGALLLTPGFITDFIGFCCLIPGVRQHLILWGSKHLSGIRVMSAGRVDSTIFNRHAAGGDIEKPSEDGSNRVIDGDFKRED